MYRGHGRLNQVILNRYINGGDSAMRHHNNHNCLCKFIQRKLKELCPDLSINVVAVHEMDNLMKDLLHQLGSVSKDLLMNSRKRTLGAHSIAMASKIVLPKQLYQCSKLHGVKALQRYRRSNRDSLH